MNTYLIKLQYQGDDRCEDSYRAYINTDDEDEVEDRIMSLSNFEDLELNCIENYREYFDDDEEDEYASVYVENVSDEDYITGTWFNSLACLIDER